MLHKLEVKLKQHTPLIHFQHDQEDATLRASEVKPKLDRFILTRLGNGDYETGRGLAERNGWLIGKGEHAALNYKMKITADKNPQILDTRIVSAKKTALKHKEITIIVTLKNALGSLLKEVFLNSVEPFFAVTNFGLRQSKGYGSFTVEGIDLDGEKRSVTKDFKKYLKESYQFVYEKRIDENRIIRKTIDYDYKCLKSGDNPQNYGEYKKSLLFCYAVNNMKGHPRWEKRFFKQVISPLVREVRYNLKSNKDRNGRYNAPIKDAEGNQGWKDTPTKYNYLYIRALLGLAEHFEFQLTQGAKAIVRINGGEELQRFGSPIIFKVIDNSIYLVGKEPKEVLGKTIELSYWLKERQEQYEQTNFNEIKLHPTDNNASSICIPQEFNLSDFIKVASEELNYIEL